MSRPLPITAAILAGGKSERMGTDKALLPIGDQTMLGRVASIALEIAAHVVVVTNDPDALAAAGLPAEVNVVADELPNAGPLGGIATALAHAQTEWVLVLGADMPGVRPDVVRLLWDERGQGDAVVPWGPEGAEPLLALYLASNSDAARALLQDGARRPTDLLESASVTQVPLERIREIDPELESLENVNTPADLAKARSGRPLPSERPVTIHMNGQEIATVQASPADLDELAVGFLVAEGLMTDRDSFKAASIGEGGDGVSVTSGEPAPDDLVFRRRSLTSGCGKGVSFATLGHARETARNESTLTVSTQEITALMHELTKRSEQYLASGGVHACGLVRDGELVLVREDIGRHNALDKVLGRAWLDRLPTRDAWLLVSGRIAYEMAVKAAKMGVPLLASRSQATDVAAEIAHELGITLVTYVRGERATAITHPERVLPSRGEVSS